MLEKIAHYRVIREIGRGAMGRVYLAYDERIQRQVAVKELLLPAGLSEGEKREAVERFKREAQAAGKLSHPNIVTVYSVEEDSSGNPYIVMEYLEGVTLANALRQGPLSPERAVSTVSQILEALEYAHQRGVVHRDVKPDNVFLLYDGRVKVADFGIARMAATSTMTLSLIHI
ncbi:MAG: serine/threonine protein kinase, partial [Syntrophales bacterium]|nr:serine/threonine protein kinase [Syntrophales bacterium]